MHGSSWIPWLLFGPLFAALAAAGLYQLTGLPWLAGLAKLALVLTLGVIAAAIVANARAASRRRQQPPKTGGG